MPETIGPVTVGEVLAGKYRIEGILGQGGMGVVVAATHIHLQQRVAIKLLLGNATREFVERFLREARAAARLKSEHVARVIDSGELDSGDPYMVMEHLEGSDLSQVLRLHGAIGIKEAVEYVLHACEAIAEAHALGIIHRDLKPANLFLTTAADGTKTVKVLDFGISKDLSAEAGPDSSMQLTKTTAVLGSPLYMAPEQMRSARTVDARADIWSLGAILFQLVTGRVPFDATTYPELILMVNGELPPRPSSIRADLPPELEEAILCCLEKDPALRFSTVAELAWSIAPHGPPQAKESASRISRTQGSIPPPRPPAGSDTKIPRSPPPVRILGTAATDAGWSAAGSAGGNSALPSATTATDPSARRNGPIVLGALLALLIGAGAAVALNWGDGPAPVVSSATTSPEVTASPEPTVAPAASSPEPVRSAAVAVTPAPSDVPIASASPVASSASPRVTARPRVPTPSAPPPPSTPAPPPTPTKKNPLIVDIK